MYQSIFFFFCKLIPWLPKKISWASNTWYIHRLQMDGRLSTFMHHSASCCLLKSIAYHFYCYVSMLILPLLSKQHYWYSKVFLYSPCNKSKFSLIPKISSKYYIIPHFDPIINIKLTVTSTVHSLLIFPSWIPCSLIPIFLTGYSFFLSDCQWL